MNKFNSIFAMKSGSEIKSFYKSPTVILGVLALALVLISYFAPIPFYWQLAGYGELKFQTLLTTDADLTLIILFEVLTIVFVSISLIFSLLFKNSKGLSAIAIVMGTLMLIFCIFQYIYLTKIGVLKDSGRYIFNINFSYGSLAIVLASILLIGLEFYKLGWQGYEVVDEKSSQAPEKKMIEEEVEEVEVVEEKEVAKEPEVVEPSVEPEEVAKEEKKAPAKKTTTKKSPAKADAEKKTTTKKTATKKTTTK